LWLKRSFRFSSLFILLLLLLNPILSFLAQETVKPKVLFYLDDSQSVWAADSQAAELFVNDWNKFQQEISKDFEVDRFYFANDVFDSTSNFNGNKTNLSAIVAHANSKFNHQRNGLIVVASDGLYNAGANPLFYTPNNDIPLATVVLGDSNRRKDIILKEVNHNSIVFLLNSFGINVQIQAFGFKGKQTTVRLLHNNNEIAAKNIVFNNSNDYITLDFVADATKAGYQRYSVVIDGLSEELTLSNNRKDFYIDVIDEREKILLIYHAPHPDIAAISRALENNKNYEVKAVWSKQITTKIVEEAGLIIGHQFPNNSVQDKSLFQNIQNKKIPFCYILGSQSPIEQLHTHLPGVRIMRRNQNWNDAQAALNNNFTAFSFSEAFLKQLSQLPPLKTPFGNYNLPSTFEPIFTQKINNIATDYPLISVQLNTAHRVGAIWGEGIWRWSMFDITENQDNMLFSELINKFARLLMVQENKQNFRVYPIKNTFEEQEKIKIIGEIYDKNLEPVAQADIAIILKNEEGFEFPFTLKKDGNSYSLDAGTLPQGYYTFTANVLNLPGYAKVNGGFLITPLQIELTNLQNNAELLQNWSSKTNAPSYFNHNFSELKEFIYNDTRLSNSIKNKYTKKELVSFKWVLLILILLFSAEWFLRKWEGHY
jgi:hypothetical protein